MQYTNTSMKLDQFITYANDDKINLIPPFQRGHVWSSKMRKKLIENIVRNRPIPAIFLYREASGERYDYNILDGKQRLESIILFVGNRRESLKIDRISKFFFDAKLRNLANFKIDVDGKRQSLKDLSDELFRDFQVYSIPIIEIILNEDSTAGLDEMISLFVDINQYGVAVRRFDIVKAMSKDKLLDSAFALLAVKQRRGRDIHYKAMKNVFTKALEKLEVVERIVEANAKVDRMWELFVEIVLFIRTKKHRTPMQILKSFIKVQGGGSPKITPTERKNVRAVFTFLNSAYKNKKLANSRLARNQIHFYTMLTAIIAGDLIDKYPEQNLIKRLAFIGEMIDEEVEVPRNLKRDMGNYIEHAAKHTTHPGRREDRQNIFLRLIEKSG